MAISAIAAVGFFGKDKIMTLKDKYISHKDTAIVSTIEVPYIDTILENSKKNIASVGEKNLKSDNTIKLTASLEVQTYYPAFLTNVEVAPHRTRWFNNIIALRTGSPRPDNPNANLGGLSQNK